MHGPPARISGKKFCSKISPDEPEEPAVAGEVIANLDTRQARLIRARGAVVEGGIALVLRSDGDDLMTLQHLCDLRAVG